MANNKNWLILISQFILYSWIQLMSSMVDSSGGHWYINAHKHWDINVHYLIPLINVHDLFCLRSSSHYYSRTWPAVYDQPLPRILYIFLPQTSSSSTEGMISSLLETFHSLNELFFHAKSLLQYYLSENPECPWNIAAIHFSATSTTEWTYSSRYLQIFSPHSAS